MNNRPFKIEYNSRLPMLLDRELWLVFWCYVLNVRYACASFLDKITPRQQLFYACGRIFIVRHIQQQDVEILKDVHEILEYHRYSPR